MLLGQFLLSPLSLTCSGRLLSASPHGLTFVLIGVLRFSSYRDTSHVGLGPPL